MEKRLEELKNSIEQTAKEKPASDELKDYADQVIKTHEKTFLKLRIKELEDQVIEIKKDLLQLTREIYHWSGRPTKDGAKHLRDSTNIIYQKYDPFPGE